MNPKTLRLAISAILLLGMVLLALGCSNAASPLATGARQSADDDDDNDTGGDDDNDDDVSPDDDDNDGSPDDDDNDGSPDDDDNDASPDDDDNDASPDDDDDDNDTSPDDDDDDDNDASPDDDDNDDDTTPSDDDDDNDDNDDNDDDNDDDDDTTPDLRPGIVIQEPADQSTVDTYAVTIGATLQRVTLATNVTVMMDATDITSQLAITTTTVDGQYTFPEGGDHHLQISATNSYGTTTVTSNFHIAKPWVNPISPTIGGSLQTTTLNIDAEYGDCSNCVFQIKLDNVDITNWLFITDSTVTGTKSGMTSGAHDLNYTLTSDNGSGDASVVDVPFYVNIVPPHFTFTATPAALLTGNAAMLNYVFYDENGNDITSSITVVVSSSPTIGVIPDAGDPTHKLWFYYPGMFQITVSTDYSTYGVITASTTVDVQPAPPVTLDLELSSYSITAGQTITATTTVYDGQGNEQTWDQVYLSVEPPFGVTINGSQITLTKAGDIRVIGEVAGSTVSATQHVTVLPAAASSISLSCDKPTVAISEPVTCYASAVDQYGNPLIIPYRYVINPNANFTIQYGSPSDEISFSAQGWYAIMAEATNTPSVHSDFYDVDVLPPPPPPSAAGIVISTPARGIYTQSASVAVTGYLTGIDCTVAGTVLKMNGGSISFSSSDCSFNVNYVPTLGMNTITLEVTTADDRYARASTDLLYSAADWGPNDAIPSGLGYHVTALQGFGQLQAIIQQYMDANFNLQALLMANPPFFNESVDVWGVTVASAEAFATGVTYDGPAVTFQSQAAGLYATAHINQAVMNFTANITVLGIGFSGITGYVNVNSISMSAYTHVHLDSTSHRMIATMDTYNFALGSVDVHIDHFPDQLAALFDQTVYDRVQAAIYQSVHDSILPMVQGFLDDFPANYNFLISPIFFNLIGAPTTLTLDYTDGMTVWSDVNVRGEYTDPGVPQFSGSIRTDSAVPAFGLTVPGTGGNYGMAMAIADDVVNQLLYKVYLSGLLKLSVTHLFDACSATYYAKIPQICDQLRQYQPNPTTDPVWVDVILRPMLPPVALLASGNDMVQVGEVIAYLYAPGEGGVKQGVLTLAIAGHIPATLSIGTLGTMVHTTFGTPVVDPTQALSNPLTTPIPYAGCDAIAPTLIQPLLPTLATTLDSLELPYFAFEDHPYEVQMTDLEHLGASSGYLGAYGNFAPAN